MHSKSHLHFLSSPANFSEKEQLYLSVRKKENRIYSDAEVRKLPKCSTTHPHYNEWFVRTQSAKRLLNYLQPKSNQQILEIGCGNGWLSAMLSTLKNCSVHALDINKEELEQATRVFSDKNIQFYYTDIFTDFNPETKFDTIVLAASVQYFPDFKKLIARLFQLLNKDGEIHILDTNFYSLQHLPQAVERTKNYYNNLGFSQMSNWYHHRCIEELNGLQYHFQKQNFTSKIVSFLKTKNTFSFPWIIITP